MGAGIEWRQAGQHSQGETVYAGRSSGRRSIFLSPAYRQLRADLEQHGLTHIRAEIPSASLFPDGETACLYGDLERTQASVGRHSAADAFTPALSPRDLAAYWFENP